MLNKQPKYERIEPDFGTSIVVKQFTEAGQNKNPLWHMHPEMEIVYVNGGSGKRYIGNHQSYYNDGDLILIGPNLPHYGFTDRLTNNKSETIIQMKKSFLGEELYGAPEMHDIGRMIEKSKQGIIFYGETKEKVGQIIENLPSKGPFHRITELLTILHELSKSKEYKILNASNTSIEIEPQDRVRINKIYDYVKQNFEHSITLDEISDLISMTKPAFCRYFKRLSNKTFTEFVNEYRLVHASKLLAETDISVTEVCFECGFNNFSHFNKQFKKFTGNSATAYRKEQRSIMTSE